MIGSRPGRPGVIAALAAAGALLVWSPDAAGQRPQPAQQASADEPEAEPEEEGGGEQATNQLVTGGLRPILANQSSDLERLPEAQRLRETADGAIREIMKRPIVNHAMLRVALGTGYLVKFFDCAGFPPCVARLYAPLRERASLAVYGDYTVKRNKYFFRIRLIDLATSKMRGDVEFSLDAKAIGDREQWRRELEVLLGDIAVEESAAAEGGDEADAGDETDSAGGGDETTTAAAGDTDAAALDELDAELDEQKGGQGSGDGVLIRRFRGILASEFRSYPLDREGPTNDEQVFIEAELELDLRLRGGASLYFRPRFLIDTLDTDLKRFEPYEGYFQYVGETWDVRLGQFIDNWGIADAYNPLNILNRRDYAIDTLDPPPLGELGLHLRKQWDGAGWFREPTISLYGMPLWRETLLPTDAYRYTFSQPPYVLVHDPSYPDELQDGVLGAVRIEHTLAGDALSADLQYIGARGPARFPAITPMPQGDGSVQLVTDYYGNWIAGGGFRLVPKGDWLSKLTLKTEVVYSRPYRYGDGPDMLPDDYTQYVAGFDRVFNALFTDLDSLTFTAEYLGEYLSNEDDFLSLFRPFDHDVAGRLYWEAKDFARFSIELRGVVDVKNGELIGEGTIGRQLRFLHDDLRFEVAGQYVRPEREEEPGFFAFFPNNSNVRVRMGFNF